MDIRLNYRRNPKALLLLAVLTTSGTSRRLAATTATNGLLILGLVLLLILLAVVVLTIVKIAATIGSLAGNILNSIRNDLVADGDREGAPLLSLLAALAVLEHVEEGIARLGLGDLTGSVALLAALLLGNCLDSHVLPLVPGDGGLLGAINGDLSELLLGENSLHNLSLLHVLVGGEGEDDREAILEGSASNINKVGKDLGIALRDHLINDDVVAESIKPEVGNTLLGVLRVLSSGSDIDLVLVLLGEALDNLLLGGLGSTHDNLLATSEERLVQLLELFLDLGDLRIVSNLLLLLLIIETDEKLGAVTNLSGKSGHKLARKVLVEVLSGIPAHHVHGLVLGLALGSVLLLLGLRGHLYGGTTKMSKTKDQ